jgi:hypothetical protein
MLAIANGAFKSGSSWLFKILCCITQFPPPPKAYLNLEWKNPSLHPNQLAKFLASEDFSTQNYLCKNHFGNSRERNLLLSYPNVFVFNIKRDLRDVVVSAYYHDCRVQGFEGSFEDYYWVWGRLHAHKVRKYHSVWDVSSPQVYVSSYERLKQDFTLEVNEIANFLGFNLSIHQLEEIQFRTSFERFKQGEKSTQTIQKSDETAFIRKGIVGDWKNHFNTQMLDDITAIEQNGLALPTRAWIHLSKRLKKTVNF